MDISINKGERIREISPLAVGFEPHPPVFWMRIYIWIDNSYSEKFNIVVTWNNEFGIEWHMYTGSMPTLTRYGEYSGIF